MFKHLGMYCVTDEEIKANVEYFEKLPEWKSKRMKVIKFYSKTYRDAKGREFTKTFKDNGSPNRFERRSSWARLTKNERNHVISEFNRRRTEELNEIAKKAEEKLKKKNEATDTPESAGKE